jgi:hypothetical protein
MNCERKILEQELELYANSSEEIDSIKKSTGAVR